MLKQLPATKAGSFSFMFSSSHFLSQSFSVCLCLSVYLPLSLSLSLSLSARLSVSPPPLLSLSLPLPSPFAPSLSLSLSLSLPPSLPPSLPSLSVHSPHLVGWGVDQGLDVLGKLRLYYFKDFVISFCVHLSNAICTVVFCFSDKLGGKLCLIQKLKSFF